MTAEEIKSAYRLESHLLSRGIKLTGMGPSRVTHVCAALSHKPSHLCVTVDIEKQLWHCNDCDTGGDVISWICTQEGKRAGDVLRELSLKLGGNGSQPARNGALQQKPTIEATYDYHDALGNVVFQVVRLQPKSFRQRHQVAGKWVWDMEGITRVLYHLPEVLKAETVWIAEGEKDADNLTRLGFTATTNVGGAGKWLDPYTETLTNKHVVICGDNDKAGKEHVDLLFESIAGSVASARIVTIPKPSKDVSEFIGTLTTDAAAKTALLLLAAESPQFHKGIRVPVYSIGELEGQYRAHVSNLSKGTLDLSRWLPPLRAIRSRSPGDMVLFIGDTGIGKTSILMNIALHSRPMPTLFFEMELPAETMFERFISLKSKTPAATVELAYQSGEVVGEKPLEDRFPGLFICSECGLDCDTLGQIITKSQLKIGERPKLVLIDYIQLMKGFGKRYEKASDNAEGLKVIAKKCGVIIKL